MKKLMIIVLLGLMGVQTLYPIAVGNELAALITCASYCDKIIGAAGSTGSCVVASVKDNPRLTAGAALCAAVAWGMSRFYNANIEEFERASKVLEISMDLVARCHDPKDIDELLGYLSKNVKTPQEMDVLYSVYLDVIRNDGTHENAMKEVSK